MGIFDKKPSSSVVEYGEIVPLYDNIIVRRVEGITRSKGGIELPDQAKEAMRPHEGIVISIGFGREKEDGSIVPMHIKIGDHVVFGAFAGHRIQLSPQDDDEFLMMREGEVLGIRKGR